MKTKNSRALAAVAAVAIALTWYNLGPAWVGLEVLAFAVILLAVYREEVGNAAWDLQQAWVYGHLNKGELVAGAIGCMITVAAAFAVSWLISKNLDWPLVMVAVVVIAAAVSVWRPKHYVPFGSVALCVVLLFSGYHFRHNQVITLQQFHLWLWVVGVIGTGTVSYLCGLIMAGGLKRD